MMKISELIEILTNLAAAHPDADITFCYPSRHAGRPSTKRGKATGYRTSLRNATIAKIPALVVVEIEHARADEIETNASAD